MEYQEFKMMIQKQVQEIMGDFIEVRIEEYFKNNHMKVEALAFKERNPLVSTLISPAIHLKDLYALYQQNGDMRECLLTIKKIYNEHEPKSLDGISNNWDEIKGNIFMTLIHEVWNDEWMKESQMPYRKYLDFAIILRRKLEIPSCGAGSVLVTQKLLSYWKINDKQVWETAWQNLYEEKFYIQNLNDDIVSESSAHDILPLYIMTNEEDYYGARAILRKDLLQEFAERMDCNLFVVPFSVHEIMLLPDSGKYEVGNLKANVKMINEACISEEDCLSDEIYYFRKGANAVEVAR